MIFPLRSEALTSRKGVCVGRGGGVGYSFVFVGVLVFAGVFIFECERLSFQRGSSFL